MAFNFGSSNFAGSNFDIYTNSTPISPWNLPKKKSSNASLMSAFNQIFVEPLVSSLSTFMYDAIREFL